MSGQQHQVLYLILYCPGNDKVCSKYLLGVWGGVGSEYLNRFSDFWYVKHPANCLA